MPNFLNVAHKVISFVSRSRRSAIRSRSTSVGEDEEDESCGDANGEVEFGARSEGCGGGGGGGGTPCSVSEKDGDGREGPYDQGWLAAVGFFGRVACGLRLGPVLAFCVRAPSTPAALRRARSVRDVSSFLDVFPDDRHAPRCASKVAVHALTSPPQAVSKAAASRSGSARRSRSSSAPSTCSIPCSSSCPRNHS